MLNTSLNISSFVPVDILQSTIIRISKLQCVICIIIVFHIISLDSKMSQVGRKEGNVLFNDALNTFYLRLYGVRHMIKDHSDSERGNPLPPLYGILFPISSKGSFIVVEH